MKKLNESDYKQIATMYEQGLSQAAIGAKFGVSGQAIGKILREKLDVETKIGGHQTKRSQMKQKNLDAHKLYNAGASISEIAKILKMSCSGIQEMLQKSGYSPRNSQDYSPKNGKQIRPEVLLNLYKNGDSQPKIATLIGVSRERINQILKQLPDYQKMDRIQLNGLNGKIKLVQELANNGLNKIEIAKEMNISLNSLNGLIQRYSINIEKRVNSRTDLSGQKFGLWKVIKKIGYIHNNSDYYWECQCECGVLKSVKHNYLVKGRSRSCQKCSAQNRAMLAAPLKNVVSHQHIAGRIWRDTLECGHSIESTLCARPAIQRRCCECVKINR